MDPETEFEDDEIGEQKSQLDRDTPERQSIEDLVPDGLDDEANVSEEEGLTSEEAAIRAERLA